MSEPIEDEYFNWLYTKVAYRAQSTPSTRYYSLLYFLHRTEFVWVVSGDDNRAEEGQELRMEFLHSSGNRDIYTPWMDLTCSVLELLVAFSNRTAFNTDLTSPDWFWIFIDNLGLSELFDSSYSDETISDFVNSSMDIFIWRKYDQLGHGGLFPLRRSDRDQRTVELWYQFCEYLVDQNIS